MQANKAWLSKEKNYQSEHENISRRDSTLPKVKLDNIRRDKAFEQFKEGIVENTDIK